MTSYGYARVSTTAQDTQAQVDRLVAAGVPIEHVVLEHALGARSDRPELVQLLDRLEAGDSLTVWRLDRLGRSTSHLVDSVRDLHGRGVEFRSLSEHIDTMTPTGNLLLGLFALLAEFERDLIAERRPPGFAAARANGAQIGRRSKVHPNQVTLIHDLIRAGKSRRDVATMTGRSRLSSAVSCVTRSRRSGLSARAAGARGGAQHDH